MTMRNEIEDAVDAVRKNKDIGELERLIGAFARKASPSLEINELRTVIDDVVLAIIGHIQKATPTPTIAKQLWRITKNKVADLQYRACRERQFREPGDPAILLADVSSPDVADIVEQREAIEELRRDLARVREENPDYFEAIIAVIDDVPVGDRIRERLGKTISKDSERQLKSRAKQKLATLIERRKEEVS
jgi:hypothetical protein